jgi:hypothetical protein
MRLRSRGAMRPRFGRALVPPENRGRKESRVSDAPAASCAKVESTRVVTTGSPVQTGSPCAMVLTACFVLSPATGLFCHRRFADLSIHLEPGWADAPPQNLTPASGRQDHTTSPSATSSFVLRAVTGSRAPRKPKGSPCHHRARRRCRVHRIPPRVRDDREPPLWGRDGGD